VDPVVSKQGHSQRGREQGATPWPPPIVDWMDFLTKKLALLRRMACFIQ